MSPRTSRAGKDSDAWLPDRIAALAGAPDAPVRIRPAAASDRPALAQMLARCSDLTRARRFHKYVRCFPEPYAASARRL